MSLTNSNVSSSVLHTEDINQHQHAVHSACVFQSPHKHPFLSHHRNRNRHGAHTQDLSVAGFLSVFLYATMLSRKGSISDCPEPDTVYFIFSKHPTAS